MNYIGGILLGLSTFMKPYKSLTSSAYNGVIFYGSCVLDQVWITKNIRPTTFELADPTAKIIWDEHTLLLANFEEQNDSAGNINLTEDIESWRIYRRESESSKVELLGSTLPEENQFLDYTALKDKQYIYSVVPITANQIAEPLETDLVEPEFWGFYLIGQEDDITYSYNFDLDLSFDGYSNDTAYSEYSTYKKYNVFSFGERNFRRGSITVLAGDIDYNAMKVLQKTDYIEELRNRINDSKTKIIKTRKGELLKVKTMNFAVALYTEDDEQPYTISFDYVECED